VYERMFIVRRQCFYSAFLSSWLCNEKRQGPCDRQRRKTESIVVTIAVSRNKQSKALVVLCVYGLLTSMIVEMIKNSKEWVSTTWTNTQHLFTSKRRYLEKILSKWRWQQFGSMFHWMNIQCKYIG
jgi:hypothetical protein